MSPQSSTTSGASRPTTDSPPLIGNPTIFIIGPMAPFREYGHWNFPLFHETSDYLARCGWMVHNIAHYMESEGFNASDPEPLEGEYRDGLLDASKAWIDQSTHVAVLPNWELDDVARELVDYAHLTGRIVHDYVPVRAKGRLRLAWPPEDSPMKAGVDAEEVDHYVPFDETELYRSVADEEPDFEKPDFLSWEEGMRHIVTAYGNKINIPLPVGETRITNPETGGEKGQKPAQMSLLPAGALLEVAKVYGFGAEKYDRDNWARGYEWHFSYDALQRHVLAFWGGETYDPESLCHHLAHAVFHCLALITFTETHPELDDRPFKNEDLLVDE